MSLCVSVELFLVKILVTSNLWPPNFLSILQLCQRLLVLLANFLRLLQELITLSSTLMLLEIVAVEDISLPLLD